jgi:hypothetical protein
MRAHFKLALLFVAAGCWLASVGSVTATQEQKAEQVYRNIQVFKGLPAAQLYPAMNFITSALGVNCTHCHIPNQFEKDDKPAKQTARRMIQMMQTLNQANFSDQLAVTCYTCHRGQLKPMATPGLALTAGAVEPSAAATPTVAALLDKHIAALGGREALAKITTLVLKGSESASSENAPAQPRPLEIFRKAPDKLLKLNPLPSDRAVRAFDGATGWQQFNGRTMGMSATDLGMIRREAAFDRDFNLQAQFARMNVVGKVKLGAREAWVIEATPVDGRIGPMPVELEKLYFDMRSGLLVRRQLELKTGLGRVPMAIDLDDYREVEGVQWPFVIRTMFPGVNLTQSFTEIRPNAPVEEEKFKRPAP